LLGGLNLAIGGSISGLVLIALGLALAFLGRKLVKILFFFVGGVIGALLTLRFAPLFLAGSLIYLAAIVGFVVAGLIFYFLLPFGAGLAAGLAAFLVLNPIIGDLIVSFILALVVLIVVVILFNKLLTVGTAFLGSLVFTAGLGQMISLHGFVQIALIAIITVLGCIVQFKT